MAMRDSNGGKGLESSTVDYDRKGQMKIESNTSHVNLCHVFISTQRGS